MGKSSPSTWSIVLGPDGASGDPDASPRLPEEKKSSRSRSTDPLSPASLAPLDSGARPESGRLLSGFDEAGAGAFNAPRGIV